MTSFGARLMHEREQRKITLEDISGSTKIRVRFLDAIEQEHFDDVPSGYAARFVRAYALSVGIDEEQAMADYLLAVSANLPETDTQREPTARRNTVQRRTLWTLLIAGAVILITVMAYEGREFRLSEQPAATFSKRYAIRPWVSGKSKLAQSGAQKTGAIGSAASEQPVGLSESHTVPTFGSFSLLIRARENAWVSINADGKRVMQDTLVATTEISVKAHDQIVIRAGNIGALDFFFNGQKLPTQGDYDEAKTVNVNKNGLQPPVPRTSFPVAPASLQQ